MQERRRADWTENKRDISKCKSCLGPCCSKVKHSLIHRTCDPSDSLAQLNNLNLGDDNTDIDTAFSRWLANIEKHERPSWVDRFVETFMVYFPPDQLHIIDGENMAHNAQEGRLRNFCFPSQFQNGRSKCITADVD